MTKSEKILFGFILVFLTSVLWPSLPQISLIAFAIFTLTIKLIHRFSAVVLGMLAGFLWATACGYYYTQWQIDSKLFNQNIIVHGKVESLQAPPALRAQKTDTPNDSNSVLVDNVSAASVKFNFAVSKIGRQEQHLAPTIRLSWRAPTMAFQQGDELALLVSLKPPVGLANPHGFNYQKWLVSKNISALGYVKDSPSNRLLIKNPSLRQINVNTLLENDVDNIRWILALSYGDRRLLTQEDWALMQRTGTAHLFAISGMHLGIVFGFTLFLTKGICYSTAFAVNRAITVNIKGWLLVFPIYICVMYSVLAGFEIPVLRALFTLLLWTILAVFCRHWRVQSMLLVLLTSFFCYSHFQYWG